jgi:hypothetical protein
LGLLRRRLRRPGSALPAKPALRLDCIRGNKISATVSQDAQAFLNGRGWFAMVGTRRSRRAYQGVETVAFRTDDGGLSVETRRRSRAGAYRLLGGQERHGRHQPGAPRRVQRVICSDADRVVRPTRAGSEPLANDAFSGCAVALRPADRRPESLRQFRCSPCRTSP